MWLYFQPVFSKLWLWTLQSCRGVFRNLPIKVSQAVTRLLPLCSSEFELSSWISCCKALVFQTSNCCSCPLLLKQKNQNQHVAFWACSLCANGVAPFRPFQEHRSTLITVILKCIWRGCVPSLFNYAKCILEGSFLGCCALMSVTPSSHTGHQWTFLLRVNFM